MTYNAYDTYMEITLESDKREASKSLEEIKGFIKINTRSYSLYIDNIDGKQIPTCSELVITRRTDSNIVRLHDIYQDKQEKNIRIYEIERGVNQDDNSIKVIEEFGDAQFKTMNIHIGSDGYNSSTETYTVYYTTLSMKSIENGEIISSSGYDYKHQFELSRGENV